MDFVRFRLIRLGGWVKQIIHPLSLARGNDFDVHISERLTSIQGHHSLQCKTQVSSIGSHLISSEFGWKTEEEALAFPLNSCELIEQDLVSVRVDDKSISDGVT